MIDKIYDSQKHLESLEEKRKKDTITSGSDKTQTSNVQVNEKEIQPKPEKTVENPKEITVANDEVPAENESKKKTRPTRRSGRRRSSNK